MALLDEVGLALEMLILCLLLWLIYVRSKDEDEEIIAEEPDYIERFKELAPGALFEVLKLNKSEGVTF